MSAPTPQVAALDLPPWGLVLALPALQFGLARLVYALAMTPEFEVVVWLPNALLLALLLRWRARRGLWLAAGAWGAEMLAGAGLIPLPQRALMGLCNQLEVWLAFALLRRAGVYSGLDSIRDYAVFVLCAPLAAALGAASLAALVVLSLPASAVDYPTVLLLWWFGDGLGLLIFTPLVLSFLRPFGPARGGRLVLLDLVVSLAWLALLGLVLLRRDETLLSPQLLLPGVLYFAVRFGTRWTALAVALAALGLAWALAAGHRPLGLADPHALVLRAQEFILTLSMVGMGFAILFGEQRRLARELEAKVAERTRELEESNRRLALLSTQDGLTGIANRRRFDELLLREWSRCAREQQALALVLLDVDHFKPYNDQYGHQAGDDALRQVAQALQAGLRRAGDCVARYGGEEFVVLAPGLDAAHALALAEGLCQTLRELGLPHAGTPAARLTASAGVAVALPAGKAETGSALLLRRADAALYAAKAGGRDRACLAAPGG